MTKIRLAKGLLDMGPEETQGVEWDWAPPNDDWVPGMGLGASEEALHWAKIGRKVSELKVLEEILEYTASLVRKKKPKVLDKDCKRVLLLYREVHSHADRRRSSWTNRELIAWAKTDEYAAGYFKSADTTLEQSVSRGKAKLKINNNWDSNVCEKFWGHVRKPNL